MAATLTKVKFDSKKWGAAVLANMVEEQTRRLIEYAEAEIKKIGEKIQTYNSRNGMDRTGNLLNSVCWGITYNGKMEGSGFFREPASHPKGMYGTSTSYLHEFFPNDAEEVNGRKLAEDFIKSYKGTAKGWEVFFAILAPYWGYWEQGFTMKSGGGDSGIPRTRRRLQFQVMVQFYTDVLVDLKPSKVRVHVYAPKYSYRNPKYKNRVGYKKIGVIR